METELKVFEGLEDIKVVFDVGARTDMNYDRPGVEVHRFEPNPEFADKLVAAGATIVNRFGLAENDYSSPYNPITQSFINGKQYPMLPLRTLDWYAKDIPRIDFLKIDTEGFDYRIFLGGKETLEKVRYLQFEYWDGVRKFVELLKDFELSLILDDRLYNDVIKPRTIGIEKYSQAFDGTPLVPLEEDVIKLIDEVCIPLGAGGNVFGKRKK